MNNSTDGFVCITDCLIMGSHADVCESAREIDSLHYVKSRQNIVMTRDKDPLESVHCSQRWVLNMSYSNVATGKNSSNRQALFIRKDNQNDRRFEHGVMYSTS